MSFPSHLFDIDEFNANERRSIEEGGFIDILIRLGTACERSAEDSVN
jgi:hypothetical protein